MFLIMLEENYDENDNAILLPSGQAAIVYEYNSEGTILYTKYYDLYGALVSLEE